MRIRALGAPALCWQCGTVWKWWSGTPLDVTMTGQAGNFVGVVRPDRVSGQPIYASHSGHLNWFNPNAFAEPAAFLFMLKFFGVSNAK
jgi:hypothetical protein